jgi:hypothetical protein
MFNAINRDGCLIMAQPAGAAPRSCHAPVTHAGLAFFEHESGRCYVYKVFACSAHSDEITAAHPMLDHDRAELERRREAQRQVLEEHAPAETCYLDPIAYGREARELVARAKVWVEREFSGRGGTPSGPGS